MNAYYNEIDPYAAQWLRNLIDAGHIAPGDVDERSIVDVRADDLRGYTQCHFFAGIGGWSYALRLAGWDDARSVWTGSCPCQPFSLAGAQKGFDDERHLWPVWRELIAQRRPPVVFGEQVASATEWLRLVRGDLEALGYAVGAIPIQAASAGADHLRDRFWFVADADDKGLQGRQLLPERADQRLAGPDGVADSDEPRAGPERQQRGGQFSGAGGDQETRDGDVADAEGWRRRRECREIPGTTSACIGEVARQGDGNTPADTCDCSFEWVIGADGKARRVKSGLRLLAHGVPARVGRLRGYGNAIDTRVAAAFIEASMTADGYCL